MIDKKPARPLVASPTREQVARFAKLTMEQRYLWWSDMLLALWEMTPPESRAAWRRHRDRRGGS